MQTVFLLWHNYDKHHLLIGVYRAEACAQSAIERLSAKPGFSSHPQGFEISPYELDKDHWTEGFVLID
ncbi:MAG: hypothetical protein NVS9B15_17070 [Acidobacteriaceae bacterium]